MRKIKILLVALLAAAGATIAATPAHATLSECTSGLVCLYDDPNYNTLMLAVFRNPGTCYNVASFDNDRADAFYNHLSNGKGVQFYANANCQPPALRRSYNASIGPFLPGTYDTFYVQPARPWNSDRNKLTSIWFNN